jgi:enamine deaminase RidA (YjgF/YER057c/UK114 family)
MKSTQDAQYTEQVVYFQCGEVPRVQVWTLHKQSTSVQESAREAWQKCQKTLHALGMEFP